MPLTKFRRGPAWYLRGTVRGQRVYETTGTADEARAEALRIRREGQLLDRSIFGDKATRTFAEAALSYLESKPRVAPLHEGYVHRMVDHFAGARLAAIDPAAIERCARALYPKGRPATVNRNCLTPLAAVLHHAAQLGWCEWRPVKRRATGRTRIRWLAPDEAERLIGACARHLRPLVVFLLYTGARLGEALQLDWREVALAQGRVAFVQTKNGRARGVPLHPRVVAELANLGHRAGPVFRRDDGEPYAEKASGGGQIKTAFRGACKRAKIADFTPHDLRHTWATWLYAECRDLGRLMELGGWSTPAMVMRYAHVNPDHLRDVIDRLPSGATLVQAAAAAGNPLAKSTA